MPAASRAFFFSGGGSGPPADDGAGVPHPLARRGGLPGDEADDGLLDVGLDVFGGFLLGVPADLPDHHESLGLRVLVEGLDRIEEVGPDHRVAPDAQAGGLPQAGGA